MAIEQLLHNRLLLQNANAKFCILLCIINNWQHLRHQNENSSEIQKYLPV